MNSELLRALEAEPDWDSMTAYQRTVVYCREATRQGKKIPAWTAIREQVGKGSPADIRRAVAEFRREQADTLKNSEQGLAEFPPPVAKLFQKAWLMAIEEARNGFAADRQRWELQLVEMQGNLTQARSK
ncbi:MAG TPA: DNA-binding protein, partial [Cellvibrionaceae bacterium]|nr:DNA-binding protein [Cellvibrionaceae bacterium]